MMICSCVPTKRVAYFQDIPDSAQSQPIDIFPAPYAEPTLIAGDIVQISIRTLDSRFSDDVLRFSENQPGKDGSTADKNHYATDYQIDKDENIEIPILGKIRCHGLTVSVLRDTIYQRASRYFNNPVVNVLLVNFTVTVLGEVNKPGSHIFSTEKVSILDALAASGDMTIYGKKENILLLRNDTKAKKAIRLNLNSSDFISSPYFFLRQGDVIMVEPDKSRITSLKDGTKTRNYALMASGLSVLIILISRLNF